MALKINSFVDSHCHMFTVADIPLNTVIRRQTRHPFGLLIGTAFSSLLVKWYEKFILFFEAEPEQNVEQVAVGIEQAITAPGLGDLLIEAKERIMTPLVMDFDINGSVNKAAGQLARLTSAAKAYAEKNPDAPVKVLPFVGLDPRKLVFVNGRRGKLCSTKAINDRFDNFLATSGVKDCAARKNRDSLSSGEVIGVKIYPPLGFDVFPDAQSECEAFLLVYQRLAELEIPVTAHCQEDSFDLTNNSLKQFTEPSNWAKILGSNDQLAKLRLNLGHFGGEKGVIAAMVWEDNHDDLYNPHTVAKGVSKSGWTYEIIKMLKQYDNTYADIAAYDFNTQEAVASLLWLLAYDKAGNFDLEGSPNHPLAGKLLWGSDYPMILGKTYQDYPGYFADFVGKIITREASKKMTYPIPKESELPAPALLLKNMVCDNPVKFLFG